jgi:hypothetical protein
MYEEAKDLLSTLMDSLIKRSKGVKLWQQLFWAINGKGFAFRIVTKCKEAIDLLNSGDDVDRARHTVESIMQDYQTRSEKRFGSTAPETYPNEMQSLKVILLQLK